MTIVLPNKMHEYILDFPSNNSSIADDGIKKKWEMLYKALLVENIFWFCRFRWMVISVLLLFGIISAIPGIVNYFYLQPNLHWPFVIAGLLFIINLMFIAHADRMEKSTYDRSVQINIWTQILLDLVILTMVVHYVGSLNTVVSFTYLFHIVLACIFFTRLQSLCVTAVASFLFIICVSLETTGIISPSGIFKDNIFSITVSANTLIIFLHVSMILTVWFVVWYLVSHLSDLLRKRDYELVETNQLLKKTQQEKTKYLLQLTHELKAPFSAIDANIQLIQKGYCGVLPDKALEVIERIAARSRKLSHEIKEMLQLANLRLIKKEMLCFDTYDLAEIITWCLTQLKPNAERLGIWFETDLQPVKIVTNEDHMKMLFINVLSNAVTYSYPNSCVRVTSHVLPDSEATVIVEDQGIGIAAEKLDKIFDEYYRTDEAVRHNKNSTGLGLAIVKYVAQTYNLSIHVASARDLGTRIEIRFPSSLTNLCEKEKEKNALCYDCR